MTERTDPSRKKESGKKRQKEEKSEFYAVSLKATSREKVSLAMCRLERHLVNTVGILVWYSGDLKFDHLKSVLFEGESCAKIN